MLSVFVVGVLVGVSFSQTSRSGDDNLSNQSETTSEAAEKKGRRPASHQATVKRLQRRVRALERRVRKLESTAPTPSGDEGSTVKKRAEAPGEISSVFLTKVVSEALRQTDSPIRAEVSQVVKDEFANMRTEWRAYRKARHEIRDEEFIADLSASVELSDQERSELESLLGEERRKIGEIRTKARETFDVRGAREQRREVHRQTDEAALELLGADGYESWKEIRGKRRPPWRR